MIASIGLGKNGKERLLFFSSKALIEKEFENIRIMRKMSSKPSKMHIEKEKLDKEIKELEKIY